MKKILSVAAFICFSYLNLQANDDTYGVSVNLGQSNDIEVYRIGIQKPFDSSVYDFDSFSIHGFHEVGLGHWDGEQDNIQIISYSPVFKIILNSYSSNEYQPYIDFGIGVALASDTRIDGRNLSSAFLFEDRISLGITKDNLDFFVRYMHYSNAGLQSPNDGIDIYLAGVNYSF